jgi:hypothetical protein
VGQIFKNNPAPSPASLRRQEEGDEAESQESVADIHQREAVEQIVAKAEAQQPRQVDSAPAFMNKTISKKPLAVLKQSPLQTLEGGNWGFFIYPDHNNLINLKMSKPFAIKRINDQGNRKTTAIFQVKQKGGMLGKKVQIIEVPFNDRMAFPTNSGGWLGFFTLKYKQTILTKDELIRQQQVNLDAESERAEEAMAAVYNAKQIMFQKQESFLKKHAAVLIVAVAIIIGGALMYAGDLTLAGSLGSLHTSINTLQSGLGSFMAKMLTGGSGVT